MRPAERAASDPLHKESSALSLTLPGTDVDLATAEEPRYTAGSGAHDGVGLGTVVSSLPEERGGTTAFEPGHTISTEGRSRVRMLLSFQRPSHLFRKVPPSQWGASASLQAPERTDEYCAESLA
jgi:hypothetical protein